MPSQAAGPGTAVTRNQRCKFRMLPNANQGAGERVEEEGNPRKDVYPHLSPPKKRHGTSSSLDFPGWNPFQLPPHKTLRSSILTHSLRWEEKKEAA